jgi:hypothetical protein
MAESTGDPMISEEKRREIFAALVAAQDGKASVAESHAAVCRRYGIEKHKLKDIEREGLDNSWPPLE